jgi:mRNA-degrading endonuclease RelE of RelBE toxin-antitoxin system
MRKLEKFLKRLSSKERELAIVLIEAILARKWEKLNLKRLAGYKDIYRVRKGSMRILFQDATKGIQILSIGRRNEGTYKD